MTVDEANKILDFIPQHSKSFQDFQELAALKVLFLLSWQSKLEYVSII